jgi:hypothetical protein
MAIPPTIDTTWILIGIAALAVLAGLVQLYRWQRRRRARRELLATVTGSGFEYLQNVLVPDGQGGNLHIDFLLLTARGVVVIDLRDVAGNIFGGDQMTQWTVMHHARRFTFTNPQTGLYDRIAAVRALASDIPVEGRILFTRRGRFPKGLPKYTLLLDSLGAEFPPVEREAMRTVLERWLPVWQRLCAATSPSRLDRPRPAI